MLHLWLTEWLKDKQALKNCAYKYRANIVGRWHLGFKYLWPKLMVAIGQLYKCTASRIFTMYTPVDKVTGFGGSQAVIVTGVLQDPYRYSMKWSRVLNNVRVWSAREILVKLTHSFKSSLANLRLVS